MDGAEVLSSRVNAMREEINEKQAQLTQLQHAKKSYELVKEKVGEIFLITNYLTVVFHRLNTCLKCLLFQLKEENEMLMVNMSNLRTEFSAFKADAAARMCEKDTRIAHVC